MVGGNSGQGKEGDWECSGCRNRNYAFRSFCNRCKQPRLLVDNKTPPNSKWLPRVGDWICTGCTNNNYASREKCKKCGQPKEVAAMPAFAMPGASMQTHPHYFPRPHGGYEHNLNLGLMGTGAFQHSQPLGSSWPIGGANNYGGLQQAGRYGVQPAPTWPFVGNHNPNYANPVSQAVVSKGWRNGDWSCSCGFHNYASRAECKKCNAAMPQAIGTKRLASEDLAQDLDNKRLNAGQTPGLQQAYETLGQLVSSVTKQSQTPLDQLASAAASQEVFEQLASAVANNQTATASSSLYPSGSSTANSNFTVAPQLSQSLTIPALPGKGARQWRDGDWMCTSCKNHNYASRTHCNKCQTQREELTLPVSVA